MFSQGDIILINLNPKSGHEQAGLRPALVVSNNDYNELVNLVLVCPISNRDNHFPLHIPLDSRTKTTGFIRCEQVKALDAQARNARLLESVPSEILQEVLEILKSFY